MTRNCFGFAAAVIASCAGATAALGAVEGADIVYCDFGSGGTSAVSNFGSTGTGVNKIWGYAYASYTTNNGTAPLRWNTGGNNGGPVMAMNMYRLHGGRLEQIGMGFAKYACCVANGTACNVPGETPTSCSSGPSGTLRPGCTDSYSASYNGGWSRLGPRSGINAFTGVVSPVPSGTSSDPTWRRVRVFERDMSSVNFPGALYFIEGAFVCSDDAPAGNGANNNTYRRVSVTQGTFAQSAVDPAQKTKPAIYAWRDYGNGVSGNAGVPDNSVVIREVGVPNEGVFVAAAKVTNLGNGTWRYDYAVENINSHRSGAALMIPVGAGVSISDTYFKDIDYHSGEPYDNTDWTTTVNSTSVTFAGTQTFAQNPNGNALRWGTMYNFSFVANSAPINGSLELALFRPGTGSDPNSIAINAMPVPSGLCPECAADYDSNGGVDGGDLGAFFIDYEAGAGCADVDGNGGVDGGDLAAFFSLYEAGGC